MRARFVIPLLVLLGLTAPTADAARTRTKIATRSTELERDRTRLLKQVRIRRGRAAQRGPTKELPGKVVGYLANPLNFRPAGRADRLVFGVMGGAGKKTTTRQRKNGFEIGNEIAALGHDTLTGACEGRPDDAARGAKAGGGVTIGISSYASLEEHIAAGQPTNFDVLQTTKLPPALRGTDRPNYMGREIDNIERSDAIIILGGRFGTLGELAIALEEKRPIGVLIEDEPGIARLVKRIIKESTAAGKPPGAPVVFARNARELVRKLEKATFEWRAAGGTAGPLGDGV